MAIDALIRGIYQKKNPSILGLDTQLEHVPPRIRKKFALNSFADIAEAIYAYNCELIDELKDIIACVKVQIAYYELYGIAGIAVFCRTCQYAKAAGLTVIADVKRNDIGSTASAYASAYLGHTDIPTGGWDKAFSVDFITVNPYLGFDGVKPFIDMCAGYNKGIFILVKTSNPSSGQLQDVVTDDGRTVYQRVGDLVAEWGSGLMGQEGYSSVGAVVGATYKAQGAELRKRLKNTFFLIPGYGAQGATADDILGCFDEKGSGAAVNASRSLLCAWQKAPDADYLYSARTEALRMKAEFSIIFGDDV